jgi:hypothetical protein
VNPPKRLVVLTDDNWRDYFPFAFPDRLAKGLTIGEDGIDLHGPEVEQMLIWVAEQNELNRTIRFEINRHDAAAILQLCADLEPNQPT